MRTAFRRCSSRAREAVAVVAAAVAVLRPRAPLVLAALRANQRPHVPRTHVVVAGTAPDCADLPAAMAGATDTVAVRH